MFSLKHLHLTIHRNEEITLLLFTVLLFLTPIIISTQFIVGIIVNALLISISLNQTNKIKYLLSSVPSLAVVSTGFLFGGLTQFILLMIPFIIISNITLMVLIKRSKNYINSSIIAIVAKTLILSTAIFVLFNLGIVPFTLVPVFSSFQLITAFGGALVIGFLKYKK